MKRSHQMARKKRPRAKTPARKTSALRQPPLRANDAAGRIDRSSEKPAGSRQGLESQARRAGQGFRRAYRRNGKPVTPWPANLTHAPAAGWVGKRGEGEALDGAIRGALETFFHADLSALRLHRDHHARRQAREMGASGFAAGKDVVLDRPLGPLTSAEDLELLAHEVAHSLQQSSVTRADGRRTLRSGTGRAPVQKHETFVPKTTRSEPTLRALADHHLSAWSDQEERGHALRAKLLLIGEFGDDLDATQEQAAALATRVSENEFDHEPNPYRALLCDAMKVLNQHGAAAHLLEADAELPTWFHDVDTFNTLRGRVPDWSGPVFALEPWLRFYPVLFREMFRLFLLGPSRAVPSLNHWQEGPFADKKRELEQRASSAEDDELVENEWIHYVVQRLDGADEIRRGIMTRARSYVRENMPDAPSVRQRASIIHRFSTELHTFIVDIDTTLDSHLLMLEALADLLQTTIFPIAAAYRTALGILDSLNASGQEAEDAMAESARLGQLPELADARAFFVGYLRPILALVNGSLPTAGQYNRAVGRVRSTLAHQLWTRLEQPMIQIQRDQGAEGIAVTATTDAIAGHIVAISILNQLGDALREYDYGRDRGFPQGLPDVRVAHRLDFASRLRRAGRILGWTELVTQADEALAGSDVGGLQLALLGSWVLDTDSEPERMQRDFSTGRAIQGLEPITARDLYLFFRTSYLNALSDSIQTLLDAEEGDVSAYREAIINRATQAHENHPQPKRFTFSGARIVWSAPEQTEETEEQSEDSATGDQAEEQAEPEIPNPYDVVLSHPVTDELKRRENVVSRLEEGKGILLTPVDFTYEPGNAYDLYVWVTPPLTELIDELRRIEGLVEVVDAYRRRQAALREAPEGGEEAPELPAVEFRPGGESSVPELPDLDQYTCEPIEDIYEAAETEAPFQEEAGATEEEAAPAAELSLAEKIQWLRDLVATAQASPGNAGAMGEAVSQHIAATEDIAYDRYRCLRRRSLVHDRRMFVEHFARPHLRDYSPHDISTYTMPTDALHQLQRYRGIITPEEDAPFHTAAAMCELVHPRSSSGTDIFETMRDFTRYDLVTGYLNLLAPVVEHIDANNAETFGPFLTDSERRAGQTWLSQSRARLQTIIERLRAQAASVQLQFGMHGIKLGDDAVHPDVGEDGEPIGEYVPQGRIRSILSPGAVDTNVPMENEELEVLRVEQEFMYHPDYGVPGSDGYSPSMLYVRGEGDSMEGCPTRTGWRCVPPSERGSFLLMRVRVGTDFVDVRGDSDVLLARISSSVTDQVIVQNLQELADFIEGFAELGMDLAELVPGYGQIIMVARLAGVILQFVLSGEFEEVKERILEDPQVIVEAIERIFGEELTGEMLLEYFLFEANHLDELRTLRPRQRDDDGSGRRPRTVLQKFARIIQRLANVGLIVAGAFGRVQQRMQAKFFGLGTFVMRRPMLNRALDIALDHYEALFAARDVIDEIAGVQEALNEFPAKIQEFVATLASLELPRELLPMEEILDLTVDVVVERLGTRYELAAEVILILLERTGQRERLIGAIAREIPPELDPNTAWRALVETQLNALFLSFRNDLVHSLETFFTGIGLDFSGDAVSTPTFTGSEGEFPAAEAEGYSSTGREPGWERGPAGWGAALSVPADLGSGEPLPSLSRDSAEVAFGQDFGHVRLHRGAQADRVTKPLGANALTSGSHVILPDRIGLGTASGKEVLHHELAHVSQQSGPRKLGSGKGTSPPVSGTPGRGVRFDPSREREAHNASKAGGAGESGRALSGKGSSGWQPDLGPATLFRLVENIVSFETLAEYYQDVEQEVERGGGGNRLTHDQLRQLRQMGPYLFQGIQRASDVSMDEPFERARDEIATYFQGKWAPTRLQQLINEIADRSLNPAPRPRNAQPNTPQQYHLDWRRFRTSLQNFIFSQTGLSLVFRLNFRGTTTPLTPIEDLRVDPDTPFASAPGAPAVNLTYVHLPAIGSGANLWNHVINHTFGDSADNRAMYKPRTRVHLVSRGIDVGIYDTTAGVAHLKLSDRTKDLIEARLRLATDPSQAFPPAELPPKTDYLNLTGGPEHPVYGHVGLRQGLHGDSGQRGHERDSHHVVQFLLMEYFRNWKTGDTQKAWRHPKRYLEGVHSPATEESDVPETVEAFDPPSGGRMDISHFTGRNKSDRGPNMPALLISRPLHVYGDLHVHGAPDDDPTGDHATAGHRSAPSFALKNHFRDGMTDARVKHAFFHPEETTAGRRLADIHGSAGGPARIRSNIHRGMLAAYQWMNNDMFPKLDRGLKLSERLYYNELAEAGNKSDRLTDGEMTTVHSTFKSYSEGIYTAHGWTL